MSNILEARDFGSIQIITYSCIQYILNDYKQRTLGTEECEVGNEELSSCLFSNRNTFVKYQKFVAPYKDLCANEWFNAAHIMNIVNISGNIQQQQHNTLYLQWDESVITGTLTQIHKWNTRMNETNSLFISFFSFLDSNLRSYRRMCTWNVMFLGFARICQFDVVHQRRVGEKSKCWKALPQWLWVSVSRVDCHIIAIALCSSSSSSTHYTHIVHIQEHYYACNPYTYAHTHIHVQTHAIC